MIYKHRIIIFDGERHDRALLALALRSANADVEILEASSPLEIAHYLGAGAFDALVADPGAAFEELGAVAGEIRKRHPYCLYWLFTAAVTEPPARSCVGLGVDGRSQKTSAGFLDLPVALFERLRHARELRDRHALLATALAAGMFPAAACIVTRTGVILGTNRELEELIDKPRYEILERAFEQLLADSDKYDEVRRRLVGVAEKWELSTVLRTSPVRQLTIIISARPLGDVQSGSGVWAINVLDVTRLLPASAAPQPAAQDAGLESVLFAVAHDLQAPLNSLASHARQLAEISGYDNQEVRLASDEIAELTTRMQHMLDGMLEVSTVRTNPKEPEVVSLDAVLADAIANLRSDIDETGATIERHSLPTLVVNRQQMVRVFQNLLANALKFRSNRIPRVRVNAEENGDCVRILFEDNGIGIDARDSSRIFGIFQRLHGEREYPGIGVGLAICKQIIRGHGGDILVESTPGRGSCFIIEFRGPALRSVISRGSRNGAVA